MDQRIVIRPVGDSRQPGLQPFELSVPKLAGQVLQKEHRHVFFLVDIFPEEAVCDIEQECQIELLHDLAPEAKREPAQISRLPPVRPNFLLEGPLDALGTPGRAPGPQTTADFHSEFRGGGVILRFHLFHGASVGRAQRLVVEPEQRSSGCSHPGDGPPDPLRLVRDLAEVMD
jgi:hypothetical protein